MTCGTSHSLARFIEQRREKTTVAGAVENQSERLLRNDVDGGVWLRPGAAIAFRGDIAFRDLVKSVLPL